MNVLKKSVTVSARRHGPAHGLTDLSALPRCLANVTTTLYLCIEHIIAIALRTYDCYIYETSLVYFYHPAR